MSLQLHAHAVTGIGRDPLNSLKDLPWLHVTAANAANAATAAAAAAQSAANTSSSSGSRGWTRLERLDNASAAQIYRTCCGACLLLISLIT
jgi:hypothetical protein